MKQHEVDEEHVKFKAFPLSLKGATNTWFFYIFPSSMELGMTWKRFSLKNISQPFELPI
jgi:hypothetical protein